MATIVRHARRVGCILFEAMHDDSEEEERQKLREVSARLRAGRKQLAMTVYAIQHGRRTPEQVRRVLDRASIAIRRNQLVRQRWTRQLVIH